MLDLSDFGTLCHGTSDAFLLEHLNINETTLRRWKRGKPDAPAAVKMLLRFINYGDLSAIGGEAWQGFYINHDHTLTLPNFKRPLPPRRLAAMYFLNPEQTNRDLCRALVEIRQLKTEIETEKNKAAFYRQQLKEISAEYLSRPLNMSHD